MPETKLQRAGRKTIEELMKRMLNSRYPYKCQLCAVYNSKCRNCPIMKIEKRRCRELDWYYNIRSVLWTIGAKRKTGKHIAILQALILYLHALTGAEIPTRLEE